MALIDDYRGIYENDNEYRQRLRVQFGRTITAILAGAPTTEQENLGRQFATNPDLAVAQALPLVSSFNLNRQDPDLSDDGQMLTAVEQAITVLTNLGIGIPAPGA